MGHPVTAKPGQQVLLQKASSIIYTCDNVKILQTTKNS